MRSKINTSKVNVKFFLGIAIAFLSDKLVLVNLLGLLDILQKLLLQDIGERLKGKGKFHTFTLYAFRFSPQCQEAYLLSVAKVEHAPKHGLVKTAVI